MRSLVPAERHRRERGSVLILTAIGAFALLATDRPRARNRPGVVGEGPAPGCNRRVCAGGGRQPARRWASRSRGGHGRGPGLRPAAPRDRGRRAAPGAGHRDGELGHGEPDIHAAPGRDRPRRRARGARGRAARRDAERGGPDVPRSRRRRGRHSGHRGGDRLPRLRGRGPARHGGAPDRGRLLRDRRQHPRSAVQPDYCASIQNPPNPCQLRSNPSKTVSCLEFQSTPQQNACWTVFDPDHPAVNTPGLEDIIENQNQTPVGPDPIFVDNGTKTPCSTDPRPLPRAGRLLRQPRRRGYERRRDDRFLAGDLPIVECQNGRPLRRGQPGPGHRRRVLRPAGGAGDPREVVQGEFVCPSDPRFERCDTGGFGGGGGFNAGIDAQAPVLVR